MSEDQDLVDTDLEDLDEITVPAGVSKGGKSKGRAKALKRSRKQVATQTEKAEAEVAALREKHNAAQLAQIVNLHIAGVSLAEIGHQIGATAEEVDQLLQENVQRYVRSQPALRVFVRNYISKHYAEMLEVDMPLAKDINNPTMLEHQDRALKILKDMGRLHGAEAPVQTEVKVDAAPESIDRMVAALAAQAGKGYDAGVFDDDDDDIYDAEIVEDLTEGLVEETTKALTVSGNAVGEPSEDESDDEF